MDAQPKRRGRPPTGRKTPAQYVADSKAALLEAGGRRLTVNLSAKAAQDLAAWRAHIDADTDRRAIEEALAKVAHRLPRS